MRREAGMLATRLFKCAASSRTKAHSFSCRFAMQGGGQQYL
jgi:hypothetical protein